MQTSLNVARVRVGDQDNAVVAMADHVVHDRDGMDDLRQRIEALMSIPVVFVGRVDNQMIGRSEHMRSIRELASLKWRSEKVEL